jgi:hypothetical protein
MDINIASLLADYGDCMELQTDYRGRGMSKETAAVTGSISDLAASICRVFMDDGFHDGVVHLEDFLRAMDSIRVDNLGHDYIFY